MTLNSSLPISTKESTGIQPASPASSASQMDSLPLSHGGSPLLSWGSYRHHLRQKLFFCLGKQDRSTILMKRKGLVVWMRESVIVKRIVRQAQGRWRCLRCTLGAGGQTPVCRKGNLKWEGLVGYWGYWGLGWDLEQDVTGRLPWWFSD